jgi:hypothetical protein
MITHYRLVGLSKPKSATLNLIDTDKEIFWATLDMAQDRFEALFNLAKAGNFWDSFWIAEVEHEKLGKDGAPIGNAKVISIMER